MSDCWWFDHNLCQHAEPLFCTKLDSKGRLMTCPRLKANQTENQKDV